MNSFKAECKTLENIRPFFTFDLQIKLLINFNHDTRINYLFKPHSSPFIQHVNKKQGSRSFISWLHGTFRQQVSYLQHFSVHLGLIQVIERHLMMARKEIDASSWYVREILAAWHHLVGYSLQLTRSFPTFLQDQSLNFMLNKMVVLTINGLFSGISDSSSTPLGLLPGSMLFQLANDWKQTQINLSKLLRDALDRLREQLMQCSKKYPFLRDSLHINKEENATIPFLHPMHYLFPTQDSFSRRNLFIEKISKETPIPSTIDAAELWYPPPLLRNSRGSWIDYIHVTLHLMSWEINYIQRLLSKVDQSDLTTRQFNWSQLQFPNTRILYPRWSSEGEFSLQVGLMSHRYFQFVRILSSHLHVLQRLLDTMSSSESSRWGFPLLLLRGFIPAIKADIKLARPHQDEETSLETLINEKKFWIGR